MKKISIIISILVSILLSVGIVLFAINHHKFQIDLHDKVLNTGDSIFVFDNVVFSDSVLIPYIKDLKLQSKNKVELPKIDTCLVAFSSKDSVPDSVFNVFSEFNVVNYWSLLQKSFDELYYTTKEEVIKQIKEDFKLYYCGQTFISKSFDSFLFLMEDKNITDKYGWIDRRVLLMNIQDDIVRSLSEIFYYKLVDDIIYAQTVIDDNGICHYKEVFISGDCGDEWGNPIEQIETIDFKFDNHGHIVVL
jgi:hypothetical protein